MLPICFYYMRLLKNCQYPFAPEEGSTDSIFYILRLCIFSRFKTTAPICGFSFFDGKTFIYFDYQNVNLILRDIFSHNIFIICVLIFV